MKIDVATRSTLLTKSNFKGYDACLNPYVGCQFGCAYCYVRFFVKDSEAKWGEFVRVREHLRDKLPKEVNRGYLKVARGRVKNADGVKETLYDTIYNRDLRIVLGTMTDPYMPIERTHRITRSALEILSKGGYKKIGVFTRSPIVLDDLELIATLPKARVHYSITPYDPESMKNLEPIAIRTESRFATIKKIKQAGIAVNVNVAPCIPTYSDPLIDDFCKKLADAEPNEFFVDPMQAYDESFKATREALSGDDKWQSVETIVNDEVLFRRWKSDFREKWRTSWRQHGNSTTLPIWCDHVNHVWENLLTGELLNPRSYND
jgi:DNA repair photolyase